MTMAGVKPKTNQYTDINPIESLRDVAGGVGKSLSSDLLKDGISDLWEQLLTGSSEKQKSSSGDLSEGQEIDFSQKKQEEKKPEQKKQADVIAPYDYRNEVLHAEKRKENETNRIIEMQVREIIVELRKLASSSGEMEAAFKDVVVDQRITKPGRYHVSFFSFVLTLVRSARVKIESSGSWLSAMKSKKGQREYWTMFKKHGTSFGMSNERSVATQVG